MIRYSVLLLISRSLFYFFFFFNWGFFLSWGFFFSRSFFFSFGNNDFFDWSIFNSNNWLFSSFSSNNTSFNGISNDFFSNCFCILSSDFFGSHTIINSCGFSNGFGSSFGNLLDCFSLCIVWFVSFGNSSISSIGNFFDGSSIFSSGSKSFFLSGLDLFGLSSIFSDNFSHGYTCSFSGSNGSSNLNFSKFLNSFSLCKFSL